MWPKNNKVFAIALAVLLVLGLAAVRAFEHRLFYDPFISFFKRDYQNQDYPDFSAWQLIISYSLRYLANTALSLLLLYVLFADNTIIKVAAILYVIFLIVLLSVFFTLFYLDEHPATFVVFYVRRFLIQPLFIILFIPAFYYQKRQ
ncbi:MAG: exosortase F system-associated protein [Flavobacterium sp.]|nr:exosortase F system-associated protein [Flavobacterium sp.]